MAISEAVYILCNLFIYWFMAKTNLLVSLQTEVADSPTTAATATNPPPPTAAATTNPPPPTQPNQTPTAPPSNLDIINGTNIQKLKTLYSTYRYNLRNASSEKAKSNCIEKMAFIQKRLEDLGENIPEDKTPTQPPPPPTRQIGYN